MNIGQSIKAIREERGCTRRAIAKKVGCTDNNLYMIECRESNPSLELAFKLADALGVDVNRFRDGADS